MTSVGGEGADAAAADAPATYAPEEVKRPPGRTVLSVLGPGLITGASDDDPSGIATYSQAGAQFGFGLAWSLFLTWPLMCAIQEISARIGRVTGRGLAGNLRRVMPPWVLYGLVVLLVAANTINIGADLGAMGAAATLVLPGPKLLYTLGFALVTVLLEVFVRYERYAKALKWMTLSLFAYFGVLLTTHVDWGRLGLDLVLPKMSWSSDYLTVTVAVFGTTISPYLFFWQASEEAEDVRERPGARPLSRAPEQAPGEFRRIRADTYIGMAFSNLVALAILVSAAATLHAAGVVNIQTSEQAATALKPIAGPFASSIFALGIVGTGLLAVPVLAASAAYATGEALGLHVGLSRKLGRAPTFYSILALSIAVGLFMNLSPINPVEALFWSAVANGVVAVPIMISMMIIGRSQTAMGSFVLPKYLTTFGWGACVVMGCATAAMMVLALL